MHLCLNMRPIIKYFFKSVTGISLFEINKERTNTKIFFFILLKRFYVVAFLSVCSGGILQLNLTHFPNELQISNFEHSSELHDDALSYKNICDVLKETMA